MQAKQIKVGEVYEVRVANKLCPVRIEEEHPGGGWRGTNLKTAKPVRIVGPNKIRGLWVEGKPTRSIGMSQYPEAQESEELTNLAEKILKGMVPHGKANPLPRRTGAGRQRKKHDGD
jgi:hypothetical protein